MKNTSIHDCLSEQCTTFIMVFRDASDDRWWQLKDVTLVCGSAGTFDVYVATVS